MSRLINNCEHSPFKGAVFSNILKSNLKIYMLEKAEITNDVALLTFVPFTIMLLKMAKREDLFIPVIVLQTIGANLRSMLTPIGNPQNLYLYSLYEIPMVKFLLTMLPLTVAAFLLLMFFVFRIKAEDYTIKNLVLPQKPKAHLLLLYLGAFLLCLSCVLHFSFLLEIWREFL